MQQDQIAPTPKQPSESHMLQQQPNREMDPHQHPAADQQDAPSGHQMEGQLASISMRAQIMNGENGQQVPSNHLPNMNAASFDQNYQTQNLQNSAMMQNPNGMTFGHPDAPQQATQPPHFNNMNEYRELNMVPQVMGSGGESAYAQQANPQLNLTNQQQTAINAEHHQTHHNGEGQSIFSQQHQVLSESPNTQPENQFNQVQQPYQMQPQPIPDQFITINQNEHSLLAINPPNQVSDGSQLQNSAKQQNGDQYFLLGNQMGKLNLNVPQQASNFQNRIDLQPTMHHPANQTSSPLLCEGVQNQNHPRKSSQGFGDEAEGQAEQLRNSISYDEQNQNHIPSSNQLVPQQNMAFETPTKDNFHQKIDAVSPPQLHPNSGNIYASQSNAHKLEQQTIFSSDDQKFHPDHSNQAFISPNQQHMIQKLAQTDQMKQGQRKISDSFNQNNGYQAQSNQKVYLDETVDKLYKISDTQSNYAQQHREQNIDYQINKMLDEDGNDENAGSESGMNSIDDIINHSENTSNFQGRHSNQAHAMFAQSTGGIENLKVQRGDSIGQIEIPGILPNNAYNNTRGHSADKQQTPANMPLQSQQYYKKQPLSIKDQMYTNQQIQNQQSYNQYIQQQQHQQHIQNVQPPKNPSPEFQERMQQNFQTYQMFPRQVQSATYDGIQQTNQHFQQDPQLQYQPNQNIQIINNEQQQFNPNGNSYYIDPDQLNNQQFLLSENKEHLSSNINQQSGRVPVDHLQDNQAQVNIDPRNEPGYINSLQQMQLDKQFIEKKMVQNKNQHHMQFQQPQNSNQLNRISNPVLPTYGGLNPSSSNDIPGQNTIREENNVERCSFQWQQLHTIDSQKQIVMSNQNPLQNVQQQNQATYQQRMKSKSLYAQHKPSYIDQFAQQNQNINMQYASNPQYQQNYPQPHFDHRQNPNAQYSQSQVWNASNQMNTPQDMRQQYDKNYIGNQNNQAISWVRLGKPNSVKDLDTRGIDQGQSDLDQVYVPYQLNQHQYQQEQSNQYYHDNISPQQQYEGEYEKHGRPFKYKKNAIRGRGTNSSKANYGRNNMLQPVVGADFMLNEQISNDAADLLNAQSSNQNESSGQDNTYKYQQKDLLIKNQSDGNQTQSDQKILRTNETDYSTRAMDTHGSMSANEQQSTNHPNNQRGKNPPYSPKTGGRSKSSGGGGQAKSVKSGGCSAGNNSYTSTQSYDETIAQIQHGIKLAKKDPEQEFQVIKGQIYDLAVKKVGSKFLQDHLSVAKQALIDKIIDEIDGRLPDLMTDNYGNYFCSELIRYLQVHQRIHFLLQIKGQKFVDISCNSRGTWALQNIIYAATQDAEFDIIRETLIENNNICKLSQDKEGHHMIEKIIMQFSEDRRQYIFEEILKNFHRLATDKQGLCVMKRLIEFTKNIQSQKLIVEQIQENVLEYVQNAFGNFVVSEVLIKFDFSLCENIFRQIKNEFVKLSQNKYASKFIEVCINMAPIDIQDGIIDEFCESMYLHKVVHSNFGNYVLQNSIERYCKAEQQRIKLIERIISCLHDVNDYKLQTRWGREILSRFINGSKFISNQKDVERLNQLLEIKMQEIEQNYKYHKQQQSLAQRNFDQSSNGRQKLAGNPNKKANNYINQPYRENQYPGSDQQYQNRGPAYTSENYQSQQDSQNYEFRQTYGGSGSGSSSSYKPKNNNQYKPKPSTGSNYGFSDANQQYNDDLNPSTYPQQNKQAQNFQKKQKGKKQPSKYTSQGAGGSSTSYTQPAHGQARHAQQAPYNYNQSQEIQTLKPQNIRFAQNQQKAYDQCTNQTSNNNWMQGQQQQQSNMNSRQIINSQIEENKSQEVPEQQRIQNTMSRNNCNTQYVNQSSSGGTTDRDKDDHQ